MKTVILFGGMGARLSEKNGLRSKPMADRRQVYFMAHYTTLF